MRLTTATICLLLLVLINTTVKGQSFADEPVYRPRTLDNELVPYLFKMNHDRVRRVEMKSYRASNFYTVMEDLDELYEKVPDSLIGKFVGDADTTVVSSDVFVFDRSGRLTNVFGTQLGDYGQHWNTHSYYAVYADHDSGTTLIVPHVIPYDSIVVDFDGHGRILLERRRMRDSVVAKLLYLYDEYGRLASVWESSSLTLSRKIEAREYGRDGSFVVRRFKDYSANSFVSVDRFNTRGLLVESYSLRPRDKNSSPSPLALADAEDWSIIDSSTYVRYVESSDGKVLSEYFGGKDSDLTQYFYGEISGLPIRVLRENVGKGLVREETIYSYSFNTQGHPVEILEYEYRCSHTDPKRYYFDLVQQITLEYLYWQGD